MTLMVERRDTSCDDRHIGNVFASRQVPGPGFATDLTITRARSSQHPSSRERIALYFICVTGLYVAERNRGGLEATHELQVNVDREAGQT